MREGKGHRFGTLAVMLQMYRTLFRAHVIGRVVHTLPKETGIVHLLLRVWCHMGERFRR